MIHCITGTIKDIKEQSVIINIGSIELNIAVPISTKFHQGQLISLPTHLHWNQDFGPSLFGFETEFDKTVFLLIISCSGIGPKIGLAVLSHLGAQGFIDAISSADEKALGRVSGIGPKKAEQIIVNLKHKIIQLISSGKCTSDGLKSQTWQEVSQALESLNYSRNEITSAMHFLAGNSSAEEPTFPILLRTALGFLAKKS